MKFFALILAMFLASCSEDNKSKQTDNTDHREWSTAPIEGYSYSSDGDCYHGIFIEKSSLYDYKVYLYQTNRSCEKAFSEFSFVGDFRISKIDGLLYLVPMDNGEKIRIEFSDNGFSMNGGEVLSPL